MRPPAGRAAVREIYGYKHLVPTHQGRAAEHILSKILIKPGDVVPGNMYFTTTRLHQELAGGAFVDVIIDEAHDPASEHPFKGDDLFDAACNLVVVYECLHTYGGMVGRDMEAVAIGSHGVFLDAKAFLPHLDQDVYPAQTLAAELYLDSGVRAMERGNVSSGRDPKTGLNRRPRLELMRLTIPRRVYTRAHLDVTAESVAEVEDGLRAAAAALLPGALRAAGLTTRVSALRARAPATRPGP